MGQFHSCSLIFVVLECGDPFTNLTFFNHQLFTGTSLATFKFGTTIQVSCLSGYQWSDGTESKTINCNAAGLWNFQSCIGIKADMKYSLILL